jgi:Skp family chaperone for outer membrane proteins
LEVESMYKAIMIGGCVAVLAVTYAASRLAWAQGQPPNAPPAAGTRVAVVNIEGLLQSYKRAQRYKTELDKEMGPLKGQAEGLKKKIMDRQAELKVGNFDAAKRKQWEEATNNDIKRLDELEREYTQRGNQKIERELLPIYREILETIKTHARSNGIQVVLSYGEDPKIDPLSIGSIARKVSGLGSTGCVTTLYVDPAADITATLADVLNRRYTGTSR